MRHVLRAVSPMQSGEFASATRTPSSCASAMLQQVLI
jgi:hypothetical protein